MTLFGHLLKCSCAVMCLVQDSSLALQGVLLPSYQSTASLPSSSQLLQWFFPSGTCTILMQFGYSHVPALLLGHSSGQSSTNIEPFLNSMYASLSVPTLTSSISTMKSSLVQMQTCRLRHTHIRAHAHTGPQRHTCLVY